MTGTQLAWEATHATGMRRAMGRLPTGVAVVTAARGDEMHGMTVNSLTSVSLQPPLLLVCLLTVARTTQVVVSTGRFNVSVLTCDGEDICRAFAEQGTDHYRTIRYELDPEGLPVVSGSLVDMRCEVEATHSHGDHLVIVGGVSFIRDAPPEATPLVYFDRRFHRLSGASTPAPMTLRTTEGVEWEWSSSALSW